jgi:ATP/maltotriose-dependent transcriptional regulator MalT
MALFEECSSLARDIQDQTCLWYVMFGMGLVARSQGDYERAQTCDMASLALKWEMRLGAHLFNLDDLLLAELGGLANVRGKPERAARLLGAAEALLGSIDNLLPPFRADFERDVAAVRAHLGETAIAAAWAEGQAMTREQAITYALQAEPSERLNDSETRRPLIGENQTLTEPLSERELEVLRLVATVKVHTRNIYGKLGVNSRTQAIAQAQKLNLL